MNAFTGTESNRSHSREVYAKTVERVSGALHELSHHIQPNSLGQVMLEPMFSKRVLGPGSLQIDLDEMRGMGLKIRERTYDTLTRCSSCIYLVQKNRSGQTEAERKEAGRMHKHHMKVVGQQRIIVETLNRKSRDKEDDSLVLALDAMSNKISKMPHLVSRPKAISDADRIGMTLTCVQIAQQTGTSQFTNNDYILLAGIFSHNTSYNLSLIIDSLKKLNSLPSKLTVIADNCPNNKSYVMLAGLGYMLFKIQKIKQIRIVYGVVGHTHNSVDSHFGNISTTLQRKDALDPKDFAEIVRKMPSVSTVETAPTVYSFEELSNFVHKPTHLLSNNQFLLSKDSQDQINWSSAPTISSSQIFDFDDNETSFKLFKNDFDPSAFVPKIVSPTENGVKDRIDRLFKTGKVFLSTENRAEYEKMYRIYGVEAFRNTVRLLHKLPAKVEAVASTADFDEMHFTVLKYLEQNGVNTGRTPKVPHVTNEMRRTA